jgi:hypothetical protein
MHVPGVVGEIVVESTAALWDMARAFQAEAVLEEAEEAGGRALQQAHGAASQAKPIGRGRFRPPKHHVTWTGAKGHRVCIECKAVLQPLVAAVMGMIKSVLTLTCC